MAKTSVERRGVSIALACRAFGVSETCYRYSPKLRDENEEIADLLAGLTDARKTWGFGLCFLHLHVVRSTQRDEIMRKLTQEDIGAQIHHSIAPQMQGGRIKALAMPRKRFRWPPNWRTKCLACRLDRISMQPKRQILFVKSCWTWR